MSVVVLHPSHSSDITGERIVYATKKLNTNSICIVHSVFSLPLRSNEGIYRFIRRKNQQKCFNPHLFLYRLSR